MSEFEVGLHYDVPADIYHKGLAEPRPLSSTLAKNLLRMLPEEALWELECGEHKDSYDFGTAAHELILQGELKTAVELPFDSYRSKAAQEARDKAYAQGLTPFVQGKLDEVREMADVVRGKTENAALLNTGGSAEVSALAECDGIMMQARFDYLRLPDTDHAGFILDLKTTAGSAAPREFMRNGASYGYHIQAAMYQTVLQALGYPRLPFIWLVVSKNPPYASSLIQASQVDLEVGELMLAKAITRWKAVQGGNLHHTGITQSSFPAWIQYEAEELSND